MGNWIYSYPHRVRKTDLAGKALTVDADKPPETSNIKGMMQLEIIEKDSTPQRRYSVLVTSQDIENIISLQAEGKPFTFTTEGYGDVSEVEC